MPKNWLSNFLVLHVGKYVPPKGGKLVIWGVENDGARLV